MFTTCDLYRGVKGVTRSFVYCSCWLLTAWGALSSGNSYLFSQGYWQPLSKGVGVGVFGMYGDSVSDALYILGRMNYPIQPPTLKWDKIYQWRGDSLTALSSSGTDSGVIGRAISYKGDLYVSGSFFDLDTVYSPGFARWTGNGWERPAVELPNSAVYWMITHDEDLYLSGTFDSVGNMRAPGVVKWDRENWTAIGNMHSPHSNPARVYSMAFYKDILYAGGNIQDSTGKEADLLWFKDSVWQEPPGWQNGSITTITSLVVFQDELYVGGSFSKARGNAGNAIMRWDGATWREVGSGTFYSMWTSTPYIEQMYVHKDGLYVVGWFDEVDGIPAQFIARWDGRQWCSLSNSLIEYSPPTDLTSWRDTLYIAGNFKIIDGDTVNFVAKWMEDWSGSVCGPLHAPTAIEPALNIPDHIRLYPNPNQGTFSLEHGFPDNPLIAVDVFNPLGQIVLQTEMKSRQTSIDLSGFARGIYYVRLLHNDRAYTIKMIRE